jgi:hypothetical protein
MFRPLCAGGDGAARHPYQEQTRDGHLQSSLDPASWLYLRRNFYSAGRSTAVKESESIMGDRSPKANQKKSTQKQSKSNAVSAKAKAAVAAKQAAGKKK